jgi:Kef-type K+ transport system membrane component KefB
MTPLPRWLRLVPWAIIVWLAASWPIGLALDPARLSKPGESAYLIADFAILLPLALATALSVRAGSRRAPIFLSATLGALAYDATHFAVRTAAELDSGAARAGLALAITLLLIVIAVGLRAVFRHTEGSRP